MPVLCTASGAKTPVNHRQSDTLDESARANLWLTTRALLRLTQCSRTCKTRKTRPNGVGALKDEEAKDEAC